MRRKEQLDISIAIYSNGRMRYSRGIHSLFNSFRQEKVPHDCHFTIQCSRRLADSSCQLPIVVLHVNIPPSIDSNIPTLLTLGKNKHEIKL